MLMKIKVVKIGVRFQAPSPNMAAWQFAHKAESVRSAENLAALMAPEADQQSAHLQRVEDSCLRRMWRLINRLREGPAGKTGKQKNKIITFKAGMCMKTKGTQTICPKGFGHLRLSFGHFRLSDTNLQEFGVNIQ
jgi:hypothetical protein